MNDENANFPKATTASALPRGGKGYYVVAPEDSSGSLLLVLHNGTVAAYALQASTVVDGRQHSVSGRRSRQKHAILDLDLRFHILRPCRLDTATVMLPQHRHGVAIAVAPLAVAAVHRAVLVGAHLGGGPKVVAEGVQELSKAGKRGGYDGKVHDDLGDYGGVGEDEEDGSAVRGGGGVAEEDESVGDGDSDEQLGGKGEDDNELGLQGEVKAEDEGEGEAGDEELEDEAEGFNGEPARELASLVSVTEVSW